MSTGWKREMGCRQAWNTSDHTGRAALTRQRCQPLLVSTPQQLKSETEREKERARERERERGNERCESGGGGGEEEEDALETWIRGSLASVLVFFLPPARVATTKGSDILLSCAWPKKKKCLRNKYYHAHSGLGSPSPWATIMICF